MFFTFVGVESDSADSRTSDMTDNNPQEPSILKSTDRSGRVKNWVQTIAIMLAGIWAGSTWVYLYIYLPSAAPAYVSMKIDAKKNSVRDGLISVTAVVTLKNTSDKLIYNVDNTYVVYGIDIEKQDKYGAPESFMEYVKEEMNSKVIHQRFFLKNVVKRDEYVLGAGRILQRGVKLEPNQEYHNEFIVYVPEDLDYLRIVGYIYHVEEFDEDEIPSWERTGKAQIFLKPMNMDTSWTLEEVVVDLW